MEPGRDGADRHCPTIRKHWEAAARRFSIIGEGWGAASRHRPIIGEGREGAARRYSTIGQGWGAASRHRPIIREDQEAPARLWWRIGRESTALFGHESGLWTWKRQSEKQLQNPGRARMDADILGLRCFRWNESSNGLRRHPGGMEEGSWGWSLATGRLLPRIPRVSRFQLLLLLGETARAAGGGNQSAGQAGGPERDETSPWAVWTGRRDFGAWHPVLSRPLFSTAQGRCSTAQGSPETSRSG
jgi:hypothetical protein